MSEHFPTASAELPAATGGVFDYDALPAHEAQPAISTEVLSTGTSEANAPAPATLVPGTETALSPTIAAMPEADVSVVEARNAKVLRCAGEVGAVSFKGIIEKPAKAINAAKRSWAERPARREHAVEVVRSSAAAALEGRAVNPTFKTYEHEVAASTALETLIHRYMWKDKIHIREESLELKRLAALHGKKIELPAPIRHEVKGPRPGAGEVYDQRARDVRVDRYGNDVKYDGPDSKVRIDAYGDPVPGMPQIKRPRRYDPTHPTDTRYLRKPVLDARGEPRYEDKVMTNASGTLLRDPHTQRALTEKVPVTEPVMDIEIPEVYIARIQASITMNARDKKIALKAGEEYQRVRHEICERLERLDRAGHMTTTDTKFMKEVKRGSIRNLWPL